MSYLGDEQSVLDDGPVVWCVTPNGQDIRGLMVLLQEAGYRPRSFTRLQSMIDAILGPARDEVPDAVLFNWEWPEHPDGFSLQAVRKLPSVDAWPLIMLHRSQSPGVVEAQALEHGAYDVISMPYDATRLLTRVGRAVQSSLAHKRLLEKLKVSEAMAQLAAQMTRAESALEARSLFMDTMSELLGATKTYLFMFDEEDKSLADHHIPEISLHLDALPAAREALTHHQAVAVNQDELGLLLRPTKPDEKWTTQEEGVLSPMLFGDRFLGVAVCTRPFVDEGKIAKVKAMMQQATLFLASAVGTQQLSSQRTGLIHSLKRRGVELDRAKGFLQRVISTCPNAIVAVNKSQITLFNPAAEAILGYSRDDALGSSVKILYPEGMAKTLELRMREAAPQPYGPVRAELVHQDGGLIPVHLTIAMLYDEKGKELGSVGVFEDVRQDLELQHRLDRVHQDLERTQQRIVVAEMAGTTAHELNQPLTSLLNYAELLDDLEIDSERGKVAIKRVLGEVERMAEIVRRIGRITQYRTRDYVGGAKILDLPSQDE